MSCHYLAIWTFPSKVPKALLGLWAVESANEFLLLLQTPYGLSCGQGV